LSSFIRVSILCCVELRVASNFLTISSLMVSSSLRLTMSSDLFSSSPIPFISDS
jgi:hypothetical protein